MAITEDRSPNLIDGDTERNAQGERERIQGINTREKALVVKDKYGEDQLSLPQVGAYAQTEAMQKLIEEGEFYYKENTGETDNYGREIIERYNARGDRLSEVAIATGIADPNLYTSADAYRAREEALAQQQLTGQPSKYADIAQIAIDAKDSSGLLYKGTAINEATYNPDIHSGVAFRDHSRSLDNEAIGFFGQMGEGWDQGWIGVREGLWGYLEAIGEVTELEMVENLGAQGVLRAREEVRNAPEIVLDYREVDSFMSGFQYVMNNAAMSAPYMVTTFASAAAAVPAGMVAGSLVGTATAFAAPSLIYAGQTWNEMEGERDLSQFGIASVAGVGAAALERLGLAKLFSPLDLLSKQGVNRIATKLAESPSIGSVDAAKRILRDTVGKEQKEFLTALGIKLTPDDIARFSGGKLALGATKGAAIESLTEVAQESLQYGAAVLGSDKKYDADAYFNRILNAGLAGGVLGGGLGAAGNIHAQGKQELWRSTKLKGDAERYSVMNQAMQDAKNRGEKVESVNELLDKDAKKTSVVYDSTGNPIQVESLVDADGNPTNSVVDENGEILTLNEDVFERSPFFNNEVKGQDVSSFGKEKLLELKQELEQEHSSLVEQGLGNSFQARLNRYHQTTVKNKLGEIKAPATIQDKTTDSFASDHIKDKRGIPNFFKVNEELADYASAIGTGVMRLFRAAERSAIDLNKLVKSKTGLDIFARIGQLTTGVYHAGMNFRQKQDSLLGKFGDYIDQTFLGALFQEAFPGIPKIKKGINSNNVNIISKLIREFMTPPKAGLSEFQKYINWLSTKEMHNKSWQDYSGSKLTEAEATALYAAARKFMQGYKAMYDAINDAHIKETGKEYPVPYDPEQWWKRKSFDYRKVSKDKNGFKTWVKSKGFSDLEAEMLYQSIAYRGTANFVEDNSYIAGDTWLPPYLNTKLNDLLDANQELLDDGKKGYASQNLFEPFNRAKTEAAKYISTTEYFGHGGRKLNALFRKLMQEAKENQNSANPDPEVLTPDEVKQYAFYVKSIIDSAHGNFNTIKSPKWAAINRLLTSWSIFAGLPLSAISSIPETAMVYYGLQGDEDWKKATNNLVTQISGAWDKAAQAEVDRTANLMNRGGLLDTVNTVIDRLSTGERDVRFVKAHEAFFQFIKIKGITQYQRRVAAAMALDFIKSRISILLMADRKEAVDLETVDPMADPQGFVEGFNKAPLEIAFDFESFNAEEMEAYNALADIGIDVEYLVELVEDTDHLERNLMLDGTVSPKVNPDNFAIDLLDEKQSAILSSMAKKNPDIGVREAIERMNEIQDDINEQLEIAVYRFVNERVQNPQSANRPLFFQDPRYQLLTQFNGFISTFTAVVIPKLYNNYLLKGNPQVKYNTFALIVLMIALGGASQYLKDLLKFGKPSPYLDGVGYTQRALYSSGVIGQYERVVDALYPLYPDRDDWLLSTMVGEAGPTIRNVQNIATGVGQLIGAEDQEAAQRGVGNILRASPVIAPFTGVRRSAAEALTGENPLKDLLF